MVQSDSALVDTNVVVYAHDPTDAAKHDTARKLLRQLWVDSHLTYSVQVLNEFYARATRPGKPPSLTHEEAMAAISDMVSSCEILPLTVGVVLLALDAVADHQMALSDALVWAVVRQNGITLIYTEDMPGQPEIEGVRYINPVAGAP